MDEEGYPILPPGAMFQPTEDRVDVVDQESGEATSRKVVVLRNTQPNTRHLWEEYSFVRSHLLHGSSNRHIQTQRIPRTSRSFTLYHELPRVPPLWSGDTTCTECLGRPYNKVETDSKTVSRVPFRVPQIRPEVKPKDKKEVTISIWREFCRGPLVYEDVNASWDDVKDSCLLWPHLQTLFGNSAVIVPLSCVWLVRALMVMLKVFVPWVGLQLAYFHLLYVHLKIHITGEKKGVHPVFIGGPSQGPMIYSIRHLWCPYCRYNRQCKLSLRYFEILLRERQSMATT